MRDTSVLPLQTHQIRAYHARLWIVVFSTCLASCSGGGASSTSSSVPSQPTLAQAQNNAPGPVPTVSQVDSTTPVPVKMTYAFGTDTTSAQGKSKRHSAANSTYTGYTSTAAPISINLSVTPVGGGTSNYTGSCTSTSSGTSGTCTVTFTAAPGATTLAGTLTEAGNTIANFSQVQIISPGGANSVDFTSNPVVDSVVLQLAASTVNAGTASDTLLTVKALDANGNTIAGNTGYVDSNGNPVAFKLNVVNTQAGGTGSVMITGPSYITAANLAPTYAHYDGSWLDHSTISVTSTSNAVTSLTGTTLTTIPKTTNEYTVPTAASVPLGIINAPDGNLWFLESGKKKIARITPTGVITEMATTAGSPYQQTVVGADGNLWFTEYTPGRIGRITMTGSLTEFASTSTAPLNISNGPDGNIWYADENNDSISRMTTSGVNTPMITFATASVNGVFGLITAPDGNLWFTSVNNNKLGSFSASNPTVQTINTATGVYPYNMVIGGDNNIWYTEYTSGKIGKATITGAITDYAVPSGSGSGNTGICLGPDGNVWFTEYGKSIIGRITPSGTVTEYTVPTASSQPWGITTGPDGNIWYTESATNKIAKFVL
jgi:streptogramin lyase